MGVNSLFSKKRQFSKPKAGQKKRVRPPRAVRKKLKPSQELLIENVELLSKEQVKKIIKNPKSNIRPSGKRRRKMLKRLRHTDKEKNMMQVDAEELASTSQTQSKNTDKTSTTERLSSNSDEDVEME